MVIRARSARESGGTADEDSDRCGREAVVEAGITSRDIVVGVASSGSTPFTTGAIGAAGEQGAMTVGEVNVTGGPLAEAAAISVHLLTGAEPIMGSTRMRAGLAQKLWLNVFSTAVMVTLGLTFDNLMVNAAPSLGKLRARRLAILQEATGLTAIVGTSVFATLQADPGTATRIGVGVLTVAAAATSAVHVFAGLVDRKVAYERASRRYSAVRRRIEIARARLSATGESPAIWEEVEMIKEEMDSAAASTPNAAGRLWDQVKRQMQGEFTWWERLRARVRGVPLPQEDFCRASTRPERNWQRAKRLKDQAAGPPGPVP
jgi:hypothetical protein